jgi:hypothetical protein
LWLHHETARVVATLFSRGAAPLEASDLLALAAYLPTGVPSVEEAAARQFWVTATRAWQTRSEREAPANILEITNALGELHAADMAPGELALDAPLRMAAVSFWPLPGVALALPGSQRREDFETALLRGLIRESTIGHTRLLALERDFRRWNAALPDTRSDSRLQDALVLLGTLHALTPRYVAETLNLTRQASARLLRRLEVLGIVRQAAARQRWLCYVAENALGARHVPKTTNPAEPVGGVDIAGIEDVLERAYAALDRASRRDQSP